MGQDIQHRLKKQTQKHFKRRASHQRELVRPASDIFRVSAPLCIETLQIRCTMTSRASALHQLSKVFMQYAELVACMDRASELLVCAGLPVKQHLQGCRMTDFLLGHHLTFSLPVHVLERLDLAPLLFDGCVFPWWRTYHARLREY